MKDSIRAPPKRGNLLDFLANLWSETTLRITLLGLNWNIVAILLQHILNHVWNNNLEEYMSLVAF